MGSFCSGHEQKQRDDAKDELRYQREQKERDDAKQELQYQRKQAEREQKQRDDAKQELQDEREKSKNLKLGYEQKMRNLEQKYHKVVSEQKQQKIHDEIGQRYGKLFPKEIVLYDNINQCRPKILNMRPGQSGCNDEKLHFPDHLFISLFGETGTGKTSLINSLICAVNGELSKGRQLPTAPENYQGGAHTLEYLTVPLTEHLSVVDSRGINTENSTKQSVQMEVIKYIEGNCPTGVHVKWTSQGPAQGIAHGQKSYCTVLVVSAHHSGQVADYNGFIKCLRRWQGRFPIAVVTKCDERSSEEVRLVLQTLGIGEIYDVANITNERPQLSAKDQYSLLQLLERCFIDGDYVFSHRQRFEEKKCLEMNTTIIVQHDTFT